MKYCPKCGTFINADVCSCGWSLQSQITPRKRKKLGKKKILLLVFVGLIGGGIALQFFITEILHIDSAIGINIAQIGAIGVALIVFPALIRQARLLRTNPQAARRIFLPTSTSKRERKIFLILVIVFACLIAGGVAFTVIGIPDVLQEINPQVMSIMPGEKKEVYANLDTVMSVGVYGVKVSNFVPVQITVLDPNGKEIDSSTILGAAQGQFDVSVGGTYKMLIENVGENTAELVVGIGALPQGTNGSDSIMYRTFIINAGVGGLLVIFFYRYRKIFSSFTS